MYTISKYCYPRQSILSSIQAKKIYIYSFYPILCILSHLQDSQSKCGVMSNYPHPTAFMTPLRTMHHFTHFPQNCNSATFYMDSFINPEKQPWTWLYNLWHKSHPYSSWINSDKAKMWLIWYIVWGNIVEGWIMHLMSATMNNRV